MSLDFFDEAYFAASGEEFEERPVEIDEFVQSEEFLGLPPLSKYQYDLVKALSQIYRYETLESLYGQEKAEKRWVQTANEVIMQLGKGSGKDHTSTIGVAYVVYLLLCLKDPARYYGKSSGNNIDIINIAINADQARNVFFDNFVQRIKKCPWFDGKYDDTQISIKFKKNINVYSGHSEREAFEGYNTLIIILDEISGFAMATDEELEAGKPPPKTSQAIYEWAIGSVGSRFGDFGKVVSLSWPRFEGDFIQKLYNESIAEKEVVVREHTFKRDENLPDGVDGNEFVIQWEEDHIIRYNHPHTFALRRPSWEVNPTININSPMIVKAFIKNVGDALGRYACMPSSITGGFFKNKEAIDAAFVAKNGVDEDGIFAADFQPQPGIKYYVHVDLAQKKDKCAVAIAHVEKWIDVSIGAVGYHEVHPVVRVDAIRWWTPTEHKSVDFADVRNYIVALRRRGFNIALCTFDRWNSHDTMNILTNEHGIKTDVLSVGKKHYDDFIDVMYDGRLIGPHTEIIITELKELIEIKGRVEHPRKGSKDLADAACGAIYNAVQYAVKPINQEVEILTYADVRKRIREEEQRKHKEKIESGVIKAPKKDMPPELRDWFESIRLLG